MVDIKLEKTLDDDRYLRIENDEDAAITIYKEHIYGHILSITVPEEDRGQGIGKLLVEAAERELADSGIQWTDADYLENATSLTAFFREEGFVIKNGARILSLPIGELLAADSAKKIIRTKIPALTFVPLSELDFGQWDDLIDGFRKKHVRIENQDIVRLNQDISGAVYDENKVLQSIILCSDRGSDLHVDFLLAFSKNAQNEVLAAIQGFLKGIVNSGGVEAYENLTAIATTQNINTLLEMALKGKREPKESGKTVYAKKRIKKSGEDTELTVINLDEDRRDLWRREIRRIPMQSNISYKLSWSRIYGKMKEGEDAPPDADIPTVSQNYEKEEEEERGLSNEEVFRITVDNINRFREYIPGDEARDIVRPFHRGLVLKKDSMDSPLGVILWKYEKMESDDDTEVRVLYFRAESYEAGKTLLKEFLDEIQEEEVKRCYFWLTNISENENKALSDSGFNIDRREDPELIITGKDFEALSLLKSKTAYFVKELGEISGREFRRGIAGITFSQREDLLIEDIAFLSKDWFDPDISCCIEMDGRVMAMLLVHRQQNGCFYVDMLESLGTDVELEALFMMRYALKRLIELYGEKAEVIFSRSSAIGSLIARYFFPEKHGRQILFGERREA